MTCPRPGSLRPLVVCLLASLPLFSQGQQQQTPPPNAPAPQQPPQQRPQNPPQPPQQKKANPFEAVPTEPENQPKPEAPKPSGPVTLNDTIESITFRGARRVPQDTLRALLQTRVGEKYDEQILDRDFLALWNTQRFEDIRLERERAPNGGWDITFIVVERRIIRTINYKGLKSISTSEVLDRFKERKVGLSVESQYDPNKVQHAKVVLQQYLAERGRQFATVEPEIRQVPPASLEITFDVDEGPKVKVGKITFTGNDNESDRAVERAMKNMHPYGIPYSIFFEDLFAKTYDSTKLEEDQERIQQFYSDNGYFTAHTTDAKVEIVNVGGGKFRLPLIKGTKIGKAANIHISIEEGRLYHLNNFNVVGMKLFRTPDVPQKVFGMQKGDVFSTAKLRKGMTDMQKVYGTFGYIDFVASPEFAPIPDTDKMDLTLTFDEGHQFFVRRIDFSGNTTTRDKIIRRQLLIDEGDVFNTHLWELSILKLNQLGYFEVLKQGESEDIKRDTKNNTVDITLKVKERGKNSVQLNGGVSAIAGSFIGFSYSTNNFLGLGETLSLNTQLGTIMRSATLGFTEPYLFDIPLTVGFTVFDSRFDFNQAREASILSGTNLIPLYEQLGSQNLLNYINNSYGFTVFSSYPLRRGFSRVGLAYGFTIQSVNALTTASQTYFNYINFLNINGPNSLNGIRSSTVTPSYTYNSVNHPITPTAGTGFTASLAFTGGPLGGNVNQIEPVLDYKRFWKSPINSKHVIGIHFMGKYLTGYDGKTAAPFNRFFMGGEFDVRGFQLFGVTPIAFVPTEATINVLNNDGSARMQNGLNSNGQPTQVAVTQNIPTYQLVTPGGDMEGVSNIEYRIPIFGPVTLALFWDTGVDKIAETSQLNLNPERVSQLNGLFPEAAFPNHALIAPGTQKPRMSTGIELQVLMPVVNAPFRVYWAYNPWRVEENIQPPIVADRSYFANAATFASAIAQFGTVVPFYEQPNTFRFTIGRTF